MYNPREAQEDFRIHTIFLFIAFVCIAFVFLKIASQNGVTYIYLKYYGVETSAEIINAIPAEDNIWPSASYDKRPRSTKYVFEYGDPDGRVFQNFLILPQKYVDGEQAQLYEIGELVEVIYSEEKPEVFLPLPIYHQKRIDANILIASILIIVGFSFLACRKIVSYSRFRNRARYY